MVVPGAQDKLFNGIFRYNHDSFPMITKGYGEIVAFHGEKFLRLTKRLDLGFM